MKVATSLESAVDPAVVAHLAAQVAVLALEVKAMLVVRAALATLFILLVAVVAQDQQAKQVRLKQVVQAETEYHRQLPDNQFFVQVVAVVVTLLGQADLPLAD
jgi:hypothetical protein